jgi:pyridinium-3,5-biscarboxylic acid mononucleotide sulfurtransferase
MKAEAGPFSQAATIVLERSLIREAGYTELMMTLVRLAAAPKLELGLLKAKQERLFSILKSMRRVIIAYSGGADSAYLAWAAHRVLGEDALAVTADSASIPESHKTDAEAFAREWGFRHEYIETREFDNPDYIKNDPNRCFHCKDELFTRLEAVALAHGIQHIAYGVNVDDLGDYRPGQHAAKLHQAKAPLVDAGLSKAEIRELSRLSGLSTWDRPAAACLSSRIPYGTPVTLENVKTVERGEESIRGLGFRQFRVRFHGKLVRIEIAKDELPSALNPEMAQRFVEIFKPLGFHYVTIDLEGYRQGSLNAVLSDEATEPRP